jgi:hypothetical protein
MNEHTRGLPTGLSFVPWWIGFSRENFVALVSGAKKLEVEPSKTNLSYLLRMINTHFIQDNI